MKRHDPKSISLRTESNTVKTMNNSNQKQNLLFVFPVLPYPPRVNGTAVRYYPILRELNSRYNIDIALLCDFDIEGEVAENLSSLCRNVFFIGRYIDELSKVAKFSSPRLRRMLHAFFFRIPIAYLFPDESRVIQSLLQKTQHYKYDGVIWVNCVFSQSIVHVSHINIEISCYDNR